MPRIMGVDVPNLKKLKVSLTYIYGIGRHLSAEIISKLGFDGEALAKDLTEDQVSQLSKLLQEEYKIEGDLKREISDNIRRLTSIRCYRGLRHKKGLPTRGQRTSTNARTRKGKKKTVANKKK